MFVPRLFAVSLLALGALAQNSKTPLRIAAASDLTAVMQRLGPAFEKQYGVPVTISLGSSGNFFAQIQNGAPFDLFLSADKSYPEKLEQAGFTEPGTLVSYARGQLVLWISKKANPNLPAGRQALNGDLDALAGPSVKKIAIANPEHAPYGRAAVVALEHYKVYEKLKPKIVLGENISQTAQFAQSGNAEAAFLALSLALTVPMQQAGAYLLLPQDSYPPLDQAGVVLRSSSSKATARDFLEFLTSAQAQAIFRESGFEVAKR